MKTIRRHSVRLLLTVAALFLVAGIVGSRDVWGESASTVTINPRSQADWDALEQLTDLTAVDFSGCRDYEAIMDFAQRHPECSVYYTVELGGRKYANTAQKVSVTVSGISQLTKRLPYLPKVTQVEITGELSELSEIVSLTEAFPEVCFSWEIWDLSMSTDMEEVDLSGITMTVEDTETLVKCLPEVTRIIMCHCGLDDETMDSLNNQYDGIRFVWSVLIKDVYVRTDAKWFYPYKYYTDMVVVEEDLYPLRYCVDMEAIDIGHMTYVTSCEWVRYMPNLKYFIIAETAITDLSPLSTLKNLVFLEIFTTKITDYSPLVECTALEDLNLGNTYGDPAPIMEMTWLKHLWWSGVQGTYGLPCSDAYITVPKALPNTVCKFNLSTPNVDNGWRQLDNYYAMRDLMDVFYLS